MVITDVLYDLTVGITCAVSGALIMLLFNHKKTKRLSNEIVLHRKDIENLRLENDKLIETIQEKENKILALEEKVLAKKMNKKTKK